MGALFSVCVPTFNRAELLDFCLERLFAIGRLDKPLEVVVSDNASTDQTPDVIASWKPKMPYLRYCRLSKNIGPDANLMNAFKNAQGKYAVFLADDDSVIAENLLHHIERLEREPDLAGIYADWVAYDDEEGKEIHRYFQLERPASFSPGDPVAMVNFVFQHLIYPEMGIYRRALITQAHCYLKHSVPYHLWMYNLSRRGRILFDPMPFYREHRVLKKKFRRDHWFDMDIRLHFIGDEFRTTLESVILLALQDAGVSRVPDDQALKVRQMIERYLHGRMGLEIQRTVAAKNWILGVELRRRLVLWYGPGTQEQQRHDLFQLAFPAAIQAIYETYRGLSNVSGVILRGFAGRQVHDFLRTHYQDVPLLEGDAPAPSDFQPLVVFRSDLEAGAGGEESQPGYALYFNRLLENYRVNTVRLDPSQL